MSDYRLVLSYLLYNKHKWGKVPTREISMMEKISNQNLKTPMKKILFSAAVVLCMTALTKAQDSRVGINTTTPAATLDVTAKPTDTALPDGLLVPRMTLTVLKSKDGAYANGGTPLTTQNGTLVFVTDFTGGTTAKTVNVTSTGFYYYDGPNSVWVKVGGGAAPVAQRYENIRGNVVEVNQAAYTVKPDDYAVVTVYSALVTITFPALTNTVADIGRSVKVMNNNTAASGLAFVGPVVGQLTVNQYRGMEFTWTGSTWSGTTK